MIWSVSRLDCPANQGKSQSFGRSSLPRSGCYSPGFGQFRCLPVGGLCLVGVLDLISLGTIDVHVFSGDACLGELGN